MNTSNSGILSLEERAICTQIAGGEAPYSLRAQALLSIDQGATRREAATTSGLSVDQVKYWLGRFRLLRLDIFPQATHNQAAIEPEANINMPAVEAADPQAAVTETQTKPAKKPKKAKKGGKAKKVKKKKSSKKKAKKAKKNKQQNKS